MWLNAISVDLLYLNNNVNSNAVVAKNVFQLNSKYNSDFVRIITVILAQIQENIVTNLDNYTLNKNFKI